MAHLVATRPIDEKAAAGADDEFYRNHPEFVENGNRVPLDFCDDTHAKHRDEWMRLYRKHGGNVEKARPSKKCGGAVECCPKARGDLAVRVIDSATRRRIPGARVELAGPLTISAKTDNGGTALFRSLPAGTYAIEGTKTRYSPSTEEATIEPYESHPEVVLELDPQGLWGTVRNAVTGDPIERARVTLSLKGAVIVTAETDRQGVYTFTDLEADTWDLEASKAKFTFEETTSIVGVVTPGQMTQVDLQLHPIAGFSVTIRLDEELRYLYPLQGLAPSKSTAGQVPLGPWRDSKVGFRLEIKSKDAGFRADRTRFDVVDSAGTVLFTESHVTKFITVGKYLWTWDGFDSSSVLDTRRLLQKGLKVQVEVSKGGMTESASLELDNEQAAVEWVAARVDLASATVDIDAEVDCQRGIEMKGGVPQGELSGTNFSHLKQLLLSGIARYWSRDIAVGGTRYQVRVRATESDDSPVELELWKQLENVEATSHNSSIIDGVVFYTPGWYPGNVLMADLRFEETAAHEWGHSVLHAFGAWSGDVRPNRGAGTNLSWRHKGSSTKISQEPNGTAGNHPAAPNEIDLMIYYNDGEPSDYFQRVIAAEEDVKRLIWLAGLRFDEA